MKRGKERGMKNKHMYTHTLTHCYCLLHCHLGRYVEGLICGGLSEEQSRVRARSVKGDVRCA